MFLEGEAEQLLETVLHLAGRLCRRDPFASGAAEICARLAVAGGARGLAVFAAHAAAAEVELLGAYGLPEDYLRRYPVRARRPASHLPGDLRDSLLRCEPVTVVGLTRDPRTVSLSSVAAAGHFESTLSIPLLIDRQGVGLIHAFYPANARAARQQLLLRAAPLVATSLAVAAPPVVAGSERLYEATEIARLARHVHAGAERYQRAYTVALYSLDHPDKLARRYGGDLVRDANDRLAAAVLAEIRDCDLAGWLDSDTLAVLMPDTEQHGAFIQVGRVLDRFGRTGFKVHDARLQLSASAGLSCYPDNGAITAEDANRVAREAVAPARGERGQRIVAIAGRGSAAPA